MNKAVFLDRDGVITQDPPHYAHRIDQLKLIPNSAEAIKLMNKIGFKIIVVSNQSGVARGYYSEKDVKMFNKAMEIELKKRGAKIDAIYYCPHLTTAKEEAYRIDCDCRKPKIGMLKQAERDLGLDLRGSYLVGDKMSDIEAGCKAGCITILVLTGHGIDEANKISTINLKQNYTAKDLYAASMIINENRHKVDTIITI